MLADLISRTTISRRESILNGKCQEHLENYSIIQFDKTCKIKINFSVVETIYTPSSLSDAFYNQLLETYKHQNTKISLKPLELRNEILETMPEI